MKTMDELSSHVKTRLTDLQKMKGEGRKIIGYIPTGYMPKYNWWELYGKQLFE